MSIYVSSILTCRRRVSIRAQTEVDISSAGVVKPRCNPARNCIAIHREMTFMYAADVLHFIIRLESSLVLADHLKSTDWAFSVCEIAVTINLQANLDSASSRAVLPACLLIII